MEREEPSGALCPVSLGVLAEVTQLLCICWAKRICEMQRAKVLQIGRLPAGRLVMALKWQGL